MILYLFFAMEAHTEQVDVRMKFLSCELLRKNWGIEGKKREMRWRRQEEKNVWNNFSRTYPRTKQIFNSFSADDWCVGAMWSLRCVERIFYGLIIIERYFALLNFSA